MEFDMTGLPDSWQKRRIRDVGDVVTGRTPSTKREDFYGGDYNLISPADLDNGKYVITAHKRLTNTGFMQCRALPKDTVLVGCIGNVGKLGMVADEQSATNQQINAVICNQENNPHFIYYSFHSNRSRLEQAADKTTLPILNKTNFENFEIAVPPLPEQQKIAAVLSQVQRSIEQQEWLIALTTELKKTLLHQLFTQGLRGEPQKETEIGLVPESWEVVELGQYLTEAQYGISAKGSESGRYAVLRMTNQRQGRISSDNLQYVELTPDQFQKFRVERRDILFNRTNSLDLVGRTAIFDHEGDFVFASYLIRLRTDPDRLRPMFLNHYLNSDETQKRLKSIATQAISQSNISATRLRGFAVPVPPIDEQDEIVFSLDAIDKKIIMHRRKHAARTDLFRTLLHQLMTAQIRVNEMELEA